MTTKIRANGRDGLNLRDLLRIEPRFSSLLVASGADPWVIYKDGWYYYCRVVDDWQILVNKARRLEDIGKTNHIIWEHPLRDAAAEVWAPELHFLRGKWYIYFAMGAGEAHRTYALEAVTDDPQGAYELKAKVSDQTDKWSIDATVLELNDNLYMIWSGYEGDKVGDQSLYIAPMSDPWTISGPRICISQPDLPWEKASSSDLYNVNEGPEVLKHDGNIYIIYSASHSLTNEYCLGQLTLQGSDPLIASNWVKRPDPVFAQTSDVFGPGHASFTKAKDGSDWIIYHSARYSNAAWDRQVQAQRFGWSSDGAPDFNAPLPVKRPPLILDRFNALSRRLLTAPKSKKSPWLPSRH